MLLWSAEKLDMSTGVFAFRMLVCQFRRELTFDDVFGFWERLWAAEQMAHCQLKVGLFGQFCESCSPIHSTINFFSYAFIQVSTQSFIHQ
jgi:hypothetical protein